MALRRRPGNMTVKPPDGRLRQSQVVSTFGPGAMVDLVNDAVLVGGLDHWHLDGATVVVQEPRLRDAIAWQFQHQKWPALSRDRPFLKPPAGNDREPKQSNGIEVLEFPRWFVCQNLRCRALVRASSLNRTSTEYRHHCLGAEGRGERSVPVRFVVACRRGHLDDINWPNWVHAGEKCAAPQLRLDEGASGDFSDIEVRCNGCGKTRRLIELTIKERALDCTGQRPWLGRDAWQHCDEKQRFLIRTASNGYFSQTTSVISIPQPLTLRDRVRAQWKILEHVTKEALPLIRATLPFVREALGDASDDAVLQAIADERVAKVEVEPELRTTEWQQFMASPREQPGELPRDRREFFWARKAARPKGLPPIIDQVVIGRRLREVQAQLGFTRIDAYSPDLQGRYDVDVKLAQLSLAQDWVPVTEIQGEGLLITLDEARLHAWETAPALVERREVLFTAWERWRELTKSKYPFPGLRFYALHALSHLLMNQLSLDCGYPASAIHERLYCAPHDAAVPMAGVLLMTGTTGAEGTLGGLVEEGKRLGRHLRRAWEGARLCSNDPVCAHHEPSALDDRHLEGAACHGCLFVPECSCERFNQYLDRALVVPTLGHEGLALLGAPWWT